MARRVWVLLCLCGCLVVTSTASAAVKPRLLLVHFEHGLGEPDSVTGTETNFKLPSWLSSLEAVKQHVTVIDGVQGTWFGNAITASFPHLFTASADPSNYQPRGPSLDAFLHDKLGKQALLAPLRFVIGNQRPSRTPGTGGLCYDMQRKRLPFLSLQQGLQDVSQKIPAALARFRSQIQEKLRRKQIIFELTKRLSARIPQSLPTPQMSLRKYEAALQSYQTNQLATPPPLCKAPSWKTLSDSEWGLMSNKARWEESYQRHFSLLQTAFACQMTQLGVVSIQVRGSGGAFSWTDKKGQKQSSFPPSCQSNNYHQCALHYCGNKEPDERLFHEGGIAYHLGKLVAFAKELDTIKEANGKTMLENTMIVIMGESTGCHITKRKTVVIIGGRGAPKLRTGRFLHVPSFTFQLKGTPDDNSLRSPVKGVSSRSEADLLRELSHAMGVKVKTFGSAYLNRGSIPLR